MTHHVVDVLPVVERDQLERGEHGPQEVVEVGEPVVRIFTNPQAHVAHGAVSVNQPRHHLVSIDRRK